MLEKKIEYVRSLCECEDIQKEERKKMSIFGKGRIVSTRQETEVYRCVTLF